MTEHIQCDNCKYLYTKLEVELCRFPLVWKTSRCVHCPKENTQEALATLRHELKMMHPEYQRMKAENANLRAALEFYGSKITYEPFQDKCEAEIYYDQGKRARDALGGEG